MLTTGPLKEWPFFLRFEPDTGGHKCKNLKAAATCCPRPPSASGVFGFGPELVRVKSSSSSFTGLLQAVVAVILDLVAAFVLRDDQHRQPFSFESKKIQRRPPRGSCAS